MKPEIREAAKRLFRCTNESLTDVYGLNFSDSDHLHTRDVYDVKDQFVKDHAHEFNGGAQRQNMRDSLQRLLDAIDHSPESVYSGTGQNMRCDLDDLNENLHQTLRWRRA